MFEERKYYRQFIRLTDAGDSDEVWIDTAKIVMMKPWTEKNKYGREVVSTYLAMDTHFVVIVKEKIDEILKLVKGEAYEE